MKRVCVFAGSSSGSRPEYRTLAAELGRALASREIGLVYGGARVGLMGAVADAVLAAGGEVTGVIPAAMVAKEIAHDGLTDLRVVSSMHERKATARPDPQPRGRAVARRRCDEGDTNAPLVRKNRVRRVSVTMADLADAFIALPGGWGTWEEFFEMLTWSQLGLHRKPCGLLNVRGYFDPLLAFVAHAVDEGFVRREHTGMIAVASAPELLLDRLSAYASPAVETWLDRAPT